MKKTPQTPRIQKGHPKHSNITKMKTEECPAGKGTGEMPNKPNQRGRDRESPDKNSE